MLESKSDDKENPLILHTVFWSHTTVVIVSVPNAFRHSKIVDGGGKQCLQDPWCIQFSKYYPYDTWPVRLCIGLS